MATSIYIQGLLAGLCLLGSTTAALAQCLEGNCREGWGRLQLKDGVYEGNFKEGVQHGKGIIYYADGRFCEANWRSGEPDGDGTLYTPEGYSFKVTWEDKRWQPKVNNPLVLECFSGDCENGFGRAKDNKGRIYRGSFKSGVFNGAGVLEYPNGDRYQGYFEKGLPHGKGVFFYKNEMRSDTGEWVQGRFRSEQMDIYVVIVGIGTYTTVPALAYTTTDAQLMYDFFTDYKSGWAVPQENIEFLLNDKGTLNNIQNSLAAVFEKADSNDMIIFYFAGHGLETGFIPVDYEPNKNNLLHHGIVNTFFNDSKAKYKLCIADACHSGGYAMTYKDFKANNLRMPPAATRSMSQRAAQIEKFYRSFRNIKRGVAILLSSSVEEISLEANKLKQGVFTFFLIQGLKGQADADQNSIITVTELHQYMERQVRNFTFGYQNPIMEGDFDPEMPVGVVAPASE